jgi:hypothetical protein
MSRRLFLLFSRNKGIQFLKLGSMFDDAGLCYWLLWLLNTKTFWLLFLLACGTLAFWPAIIGYTEDKADRIKQYDFKKLGDRLQKAYDEEDSK